MKTLPCSLIVAALVSWPALGADGPSLLGTWTGQRDRIAKVEGRRGGLATLVITQGGQHLCRTVEALKPDRR